VYLGFKVYYDAFYHASTRVHVLTPTNFFKTVGIVKFNPHFFFLTKSKWISMCMCVFVCACVYVFVCVDACVHWFGIVTSNPHVFKVHLSFKVYHDAFYHSFTRVPHVLTPTNFFKTDGIVKFNPHFSFSFGSLCVCVYLCVRVCMCLCV